MDPSGTARNGENNPPRHTATVDGILGAYAATSTLPYRHTANDSGDSDPFAEDSAPRVPQRAQRALPTSLPPLSATNSPSLSTPFLDSPRPSESSWSPTASPYASPSSRSAPKSRHDDSARYARSDDGDSTYPGDAPFIDTPFRMAMERQGGSISGHSDYASETAMDIRGDRAEWLPTPHHLYASSNMSHDDVSRVFNTQTNSPAESSNEHSGSSSSRRYNLGTLSPEVLSLFEKSRYSKEADDALHEPGPKGARSGPDRKIMETNEFKGPTVLSSRGALNMLGVGILLGGIVMLFAGYPILDYFTRVTLSNYGAFNVGGMNSSGQVPMIPSFRGLIDKDTPANVMRRTGFDKKDYQLVFSDEFNQPGRTFYPGDDPFFEAVDLHYWQTNDLEWYDPGNVETEGGYLKISLTKETLANSHNMGYLGGMLQSWNKFCFTGGYLEVAVSLPGDNVVQGLWPAAWTMGNLGRAGFGGSLDGNWPYTYDTCDLGTLANQTSPTGQPVLPPGSGDFYNGDSLSYLPGQRLSACTCPGENHPGPMLSDGTLRGRAASEIDIFEATIDPIKGGHVSLSAQWAPYNPGYEYDNSSTATVEIFPSEYDVEPNTYLGGVFQMVTSCLAKTNPLSYNSTTNFQKYGFEYTPTYIDGQGTGRITWTQDDKAMWTLHDKAMAANRITQVSDRPVTGEPLYIILNLGFSLNFGRVNFNELTFPAVMRVDYVRVYQPTDRVNIGCDPKEFPTAEYIKNNLEAYKNPNITVLADMGQKFPKNRLLTTC